MNLAYLTSMALAYAGATLVAAIVVLAARVLRLDGSHLLYGRRNTHFDTQNRALAEIVEILPPENPKI